MWQLNIKANVTNWKKNLILKNFIVIKFIHKKLRIKIFDYLSKIFKFYDIDRYATLNPNQINIKKEWSFIKYSIFKYS